MDTASRKIIQYLLKKYRFRPVKMLGQNFLINKQAVEQLVGAANLTSSDTVLEIGPGLGTLTQELVKKAGKVIAIEKDLKMMEVLKETLNGFKNVSVLQGDILKYVPDYKLQTTNYKLIGNLPFYLTAPVIRKFLETNNPPKEMVLMVQKEVGQRICAKPPKMSILAVSVQFYSKVEIINYVSKKSFWPQPKVDSAIIRISNIREQKTKNDLFFKIVKAGFSQPRKQLINNLSKNLEIDRSKIESWLLGNNIQPTQRAETLSVGDWLNLVKTLK